MERNEEFLWKMLYYEMQFLMLKHLNFPRNMFVKSLENLFQNLFRYFRGK